ncbi:zinc finger protein [Streptomyces lydicamycinicus]|uniref:Zinc finger protein n=1 Tax=Streptomyces lydicamycinicus TaxID=1546107 RepID=A0A0P4R422_9ACTN|nr:zinc finger protein [Streptomyces lydicamycinicus]
MALRNACCTRGRLSLSSETPAGRDLRVFIMSLPFSCTALQAVVSRIRPTRRQFLVHPDEARSRRCQGLAGAAP